MRSRHPQWVCEDKLGDMLLQNKAGYWPIQRHYHLDRVEIIFRLDQLTVLSNWGFEGSMVILYLTTPSCQSWGKLWRPE